MIHFPKLGGHMLTRRFFMVGTGATIPVTSFTALGFLHPAFAEDHFVAPAKHNSFDPLRSWSTAYLEIANSIGRREVVAGLDAEPPSNSYLISLERLDADLRYNERQARNAKLGLSIAFEPTEQALEFAKTTAPAPLSYYVWGVEKLLTAQKDFLFNGIERKRVETGQNLAQAAAQRLSDNRNLPYSGLFPVNNPDLASRHMREAANEILSLDNSLTGDERSVLLGSMLEGFLNLYDAGRLSDEANVGQTCDCEAVLNDTTQNLRLVGDTVEAAMSAELALAEQGVVVAEALRKAEERLQSGEEIPASFKEEVREHAETIVKFARVSQDVVEAAVALGLSPEIGAKINRLAGLAEQGAQTALAFASGNPYAIVSATSQLITGIFGKSGGPQSYLTEIFSALQGISERLAEIQKMQARIYQNVQAIQQNQIATAQLIQGAVREVQINRRLVIDIFDGDLHLLSREVDRFGLSHGVRNGWGPGWDYQAYSDIWRTSGTIFIRGLNALEAIFSSRAMPHQLLQESTYFGQDEVSVEVNENTISLAVQNDGRLDEAIELQERRQALRERHLHSFFFTEASNMMGMLFPKVLLSDNVAKNEADGDAPLLETGILLKLGWLACSTYFLHELLVDNGNPSLKTEAEILDGEGRNLRGYLILEDVLRWVDIAIQQRLILGDGYDRVLFLDGLRKGNVSTDDEWPEPFGPEDRIGKRFADIQFSIASLRYGEGNYDPRWVNEMFLPVARGYHKSWENCDGIGWECEFYNGGWPSYAEAMELEARALDVLTSIAPFSISTANEDPSLHFTIHHRNPPADSTVEPVSFLGDQFSDLELFSWFFDGQMIPAQWSSETASLFAPWVRAELNGRDIAEQLRAEAAEPHITKISQYNAPEECSRDAWTTIIVEDCPAPPAWVDWSLEHATKVAETTSGISFEDLDLHRDTETGRFHPEVEALLELKSSLLRHLTPYRLYQSGDSALKQRIVDAIRVSSTG